MKTSRNRVGSILLIATLALAACSAEPKSLADYIAALCATPFRSASPYEEPFLAENVSTMTKMMIDMGIRPSGDVDKDFVAMMTPHHNRDGHVGAALRPQRAAATDGSGDHHHSAAGDRRDAAGSQSANPTIRAVVGATGIGATLVKIYSLPSD
jgi:hypothetical protein